jgi:hypothetical protein
MQKIFSSMIAAIGRQLKQSVKVFQSSAGGGGGDGDGGRR